jgi:2-polyprenyl-3-methyl-5-hydroxy-6-metoxy-1,4-benzoquinol methylase
MPSQEWNVSTWDGQYDWNQRGEEWSASWGNSEAQWFGSIYPRIHRYLPAAKILELAPGFGRWTKFLLSACRDLTGVDLSSECISHLQQRFAGRPAAFFQNDGRSLASIADRKPFDFIFSFDSLVHVEMDVLDHYIGQVVSLLAPDGAVFFHHSNWAATDVKEENVHFRAASVSAEKVSAAIVKHGGRVMVQELINWGCQGLSDCLTLFGQAAIGAPASVLLANHEWMAEAAMIKNWHCPYTAVSDRGPR